MKKNNSYRYPKTVREMVEGQRHYVLNEEKLPSVTTILSATQSDEKRESLAKWRERVGEAEATRIVDSAGARGTACLLYTSPSPRDRTRSRMPSSA